MNYFLSYIWAIVWGLIICVLLLLPSNNFGGMPRFQGIDKLVHLGVFFVQAMLLYWEATLKSKRRVGKWITVLKVVVTTGIFACLTEMGQMYLTKTRSADPWDVFADMLGVGMATFAFILLYKREKGVRRRI